MEPRPSTSVLLPTVRWTSACEEIAGQLGPDDELLIIADTSADPVVDHAECFPDGVRLLLAGEPSGCSGKANAIAVGMEEAQHDRTVWTDDDFHHPSTWLDDLHTAYDRHGAVTELPVFVGRDPLSMLLEPIYAVVGTLGVYGTNKAWGGAVMFERDELDEAKFLAELRTTLSDDGLLSEHLDVTPVWQPRTVPIGGNVHKTIERHVRFAQIVRHHEPINTAVMLVIATVAAIGSLLYPLAGIVLATLLVGAVYAALGLRRCTVLLAYPALLVHIPLLVYGLSRRTFVWTGRRYRWRGKFDVEIVGTDGDG